MKKERRKFTKEFKIEAVQLLEHSGKTGVEIAKDLGINSNVIYRWLKEMGEKNIRVFPGNGNARDEELIRLRGELAVVKEEREILRKAVAIFSKEGE